MLMEDATDLTTPGSVNAGQGSPCTEPQESKTVSPALRALPKAGNARRRKTAGLGHNPELTTRVREALAPALPPGFEIA
jgi:hypothetical protein